MHIKPFSRCQRKAYLILCGKRGCNNLQQAHLTLAEDSDLPSNQTGLSNWRWWKSAQGTEILVFLALWAQLLGATVATTLLVRD